jgi:hypothetical protein
LRKLIKIFSPSTPIVLHIQILIQITAIPRRRKGHAFNS